MQAEAALRNSIVLALTSGDGPHRVQGLRLFVNSTGALFDNTGRLVRYGLAKGSSDLLGWLQPTGRVVSLEVKLPPPKSARLTDEQKAWLAMVERDGGIAGVVRSVEEAYAIVTAGRASSSSPAVPTPGP